MIYNGKESVMDLNLYEVEYSCDGPCNL